MNKQITLNKKQLYFLDQKFFLLKHGKIISRYILENGKIISNENCIKAGEFIGNFFSFLPTDLYFVPEFEVEIEALENNTILEEVDTNFFETLKNTPAEKIIIQLIRNTYIKYFQHLFNTKGYIMSVLKLYADASKTISKDEINPENFNVSRSLFYATYSTLKKENFITEKNKIIYLNSNKIDTYLKGFCA